MKGICCHLGLLFLCAHAWLAAEQARAQSPAAESAAFFSSGKVIHLKITVEGKELEALRREPRKYAKATLIEDDSSPLKDVGIHLKGAAGSYRDFDDKPGLTLNVAKFVEERRFHGMGKFHLANSVQDPSYVQELICGELFRAAGVPASRIGHALVTLNGRPRGLYYLKEGYDKHFLKANFGNRLGNLYDGGFLRDLDQPLVLLAGKDDVKPGTDLKKLVAAAREGNLKDRFQKIAAVLDMDKFISYLALEVITWDWDGYPMNRNNYRIYHDPARDKLVFFPSGMDQMFGDPSGPILPNFQGFIARALIETPEGKARYLARMEEIITKVYNTEKMLKRLNELQDRIQTAIARIDPGAVRAYAPHVDRLREAIKTRHKSVMQQLLTLKKR
jgi:spore coat protein CotH